MPLGSGTLITGASSGLGAEIAVHLSASRRLVLHGRDLDRLERVRSRCERPHDHDVWTHDLRDVTGVEPALRDLLTTREISIEAFVHCAGMLKVLPMRDVGPALAADTMAVNVLSAAEIVRQLIKKKVNGAALRHVVFISSTASLFGARGFNLYCASKGALDALMRALAVELAPGVRVNSVLPGAVRTQMTDQMFADPVLGARLAADYPLGVGQPSDVVSAVAFLLSDGARWVTGQQLVVDGGRTVNITA